MSLLHAPSPPLDIRALVDHYLPQDQPLPELHFQPWKSGIWLLLMLAGGVAGLFYGIALNDPRALPAALLFGLAAMVATWRIAFAGTGVTLNADEWHETTRIGIGIRRTWEDTSAIVRYRSGLSDRIAYVDQRGRGPVLFGRRNTALRGRYEIGNVELAVIMEAYRRRALDEKKDGTVVPDDWYPTEVPEMRGLNYATALLLVMVILTLLGTL